MMWTEEDERLYKQLIDIGFKVDCPQIRATNIRLFLRTNPDLRCALFDTSRQAQAHSLKRWTAELPRMRNPAKVLPYLIEKAEDYDLNPPASAKPKQCDWCDDGGIWLTDAQTKYDFWTQCPECHPHSKWPHGRPKYGPNAGDYRDDFYPIETNSNEPFLSRERSQDDILLLYKAIGLTHQPERKLTKTRDEMTSSFQKAMAEYEDLLSSQSDWDGAP